MPMGDLVNMPIRLVKGDRLIGETQSVVRNLFPATGNESFADIKAAGLPPGVTFDPKSQLLAGAPTQSGVYYATFAAKNQSGFTFTVLAKFMVCDMYYLDVSDPADVNTIPGEWLSCYGLDYLQVFDWGSIFQVGFIPGSNYGGRYEDYNWGYMIPEDDMYLGCYSNSGGKHDGVVSISGLPKGVSMVEDKDGDYVNLETKEYSVPVEAGWTRLTVKVKNPYNSDQNEGVFSRMVPVFDSPSRFVAPKVAGGGGSVSGGGVWDAGKQYNVAAVPSRGYVFSGWYRDRECTIVAENWTFGNECDYRQPNQVWTVESIDNYMPMGMPTPVYLYAKFTPVSEVNEPSIEILGYAGSESQPYYEPDYTGAFEDGSLVLNIVNNRENFYGGASDFAFVVNADSLPTVTMNGLPAGAGLDASFADGLCAIEFCEDGEGELVPGTYPVRMVVKVNGTTYNYDFTIVVGNKRSGFNYGLDYSADAQRYQCKIGAAAEFYLVSQADAYDRPLSVKNLPTGMVWDPSTGMVTGVPSKTGRYTVAIITEGSEYGEKYEDTVTVCVDALPGWVVGKFYGSVITHGYGWEWPTLLTVDISNSGIAKASLSDPEPGVVSRTTEISMRFDDENTLRCDFVLDTDFECSSGTFYIRPHDCHGGVIGVLTGSEEGVDEDDDYFTAEWKAYQHMFDKETDVVLPWFPLTDNTCQLDTSDEVGKLTFKFGEDGLVATTAQNRDYVMQNSWLSLIDYDEQLRVVTARLYVDGYNSRTDEAVGYDMDLSIPCDGNEKASASGIVIDLADTIRSW
jgi:hypothetical protein